MVASVLEESSAFIVRNVSVVSQVVTNHNEVQVRELLCHPLVLSSPKQ